MLETRNPIFVNFKLSTAEADAIRKNLGQGYELCPVKFTNADALPEYWLSYNFYELKYPKKELQKIRKVRCEINTFVKDTHGRKGIYVFSGSPYVSRETKFSVIGLICDFAELLVTFIYGVGKLTQLIFDLKSDRLEVQLNEGPNKMTIKQDVSSASQDQILSHDYWSHNDISFFNSGKSYDHVFTNSEFFAAKFKCIEGANLSPAEIKSPFVNRAPDKILFHHGDISYLVNSMNKAMA